MAKHSHIALSVLALTMLLGAVRGQPPGSTVWDVDALLGQLGQGGIVNNQVNRRKAGDLARESAVYVSGKVYEEPLQRKGELDSLSRSSNRELSEAARRLKPAIEMLDQAAAAEKSSKELIAKLRQQNGPTGEELVAAAADFMHGLDASDLDDMVRRGQVTQQEADEYLRLRGKANANFMNKFAKSFGDALTINIVTFQKTHRLRHRSEVLQNNVVAEVLAPALKARAGSDTKSPPLQVKLGLFSAGAGTGLGWYDAKVNIRSSATQELTRLTLLMEFQTTQGSRYATIYVPKLPPGGGGAFDPIALSWMYLNNPPKDIPKDLVSMTLGNTRVRYSVWCDQFRAEGQEPATTDSKAEWLNETRLLALLPGSAYVSEGGNNLNPNPAAANVPPPRGSIGGGPSTPAPYLQEYEPDGRFELVFKKLTPAQQDYQVEVQLTDRRAKTPQQFRGTLTLPTVKFDSFDKRLALELTSGKQELRLELNDSSYGGATWRGGKGLVNGRTFSPLVPPVPGSAEAAASERLRAAADLFLERKYEEAQRAYERIAADYPNTVWGMTAVRQINYLKEIERKSPAAQQAAAEARQKILDARRGMAKPNQPESGKPASTPPLGGRSPLARPNNAPSPTTSVQPAVDESETITQVTVDDVEYKFQGLSRSGAAVLVTVLATSKKGDRAAPQGQLTLVDGDGMRYTGNVDGGTRTQLREGVPLKLTWRFGPNAFTGKSSAPSPKIKEFKLVTIGPTGFGSTAAINFRNVPANTSKR